MKIELPVEPLIIENKDFQTIQIRVLFPFIENEKDLAKLILLPSMLMYMNKRYDTEDKFQKMKKKNYILGTSCSKMVFGTTGFFCFNMLVPDVLALGFNHLEEQFKFLEEIIYYPKVIDLGFDSFELEREKENLKIGIENGMKKLTTYQSVKSLELVDDDGILSRGIENHTEQIDEVTPENLYQFYLENIYNKQPIVFIMGNVNKKEITSYVKKYLYKQDIKNVSFDKKYNYFLKPRKKVNEVTEKGHFKDSSLSLFYKVDNMSQKDFLYLDLVESLLTSLSSRLLSRKLRDEYELIYSSKVVSYVRFGVFEITVFINKNNKDMALEKINEVLEELKDPEFIRDFLEKIKERRRINLIKSLDNKYDILKDVIFKKLDIENTRKEDYEIVKNVTAEEVSEFVERLQLDTVYFIEEEENE